MRSTHTYALIEISGPAFNEIAQKLLKAGYQHAFGGNGEIDMHGIGLGVDKTITAETTTIETLSLLSARTKQGLVQLRVNDAVVQMDLDKAREVRGMLDGAIEAAVSDQLVYEYLTKKLGLDADRAGRALLDFRELRQGSRNVVFPS